MRWLNLPNAITLGRIALAVVLAPLVLTDDFTLRLAGFVVFLVAAISDLVDGQLARKRNLITDFGKLADPLADKLLLVSTFVSFYLLSHGMEPETPFPWFGDVLPWWILAIIFGRELFITVFRSFAAQRGVVLAAGAAGKLKSVFQNIANGGIIFWYALWSGSREFGWAGQSFWDGFWVHFHRIFVIFNLTVAVVLTVWSLVVYLRSFRALDLGRKQAP
ncbi:MAG TPA: CDP-diacylglycerol--glycerol-3-phosphate 3-phosphatidyltransferase [Longimicrobiaceae bacterium]|nr:CDP-diacylglycerol--glycerol-3-phosphate 3-phosphatidyltransferase [Longimicrobiaceae bacterium]